VVENAPANRRGFLSAWPQTGGFSGQLLATGAFALVGMLSEEQLISWGWRLPFLASSVLVIFGLYLRSKLDETAIFKERQAHARKQEKAPAPFFEVIRHSWRNLVLIMLLRFAESVPFFLVTVFAVSYATGQLGISRTSLLGVIMLTCVIAFPMHGIFGAISDRIGRRPVYIFGAVMAAVSAFPFFYLLQTGNWMLIALGYILLINIAHNSINAVQPAFFTELFGAKVRYSGASIGHQLGAIVAGGATPFVAKALSAADNNGWTYVAAYVVAGAVVSTLAAYFGPETSKRNLAEDR
jgi:MFS family permease